MQQPFFKEALDTESAKTFRDGLWDALDAYIDSNEDNKEKIPDFNFVEIIFGDLTKNQLSLSEIFKKIKQYVLDKGYDQAHQIFQELSTLDINSKYAAVFLEDEQNFSQSVVAIHEPTKNKLKKQITDFSTPSDHRDELVLLMMHDRSQKQSYNGYLVDANPFTIMLPSNQEELLMEKEEGKIAHTRRENKLLFEEIDRVISEDKSGSNRIQIIVKSGPHYTVLDIDKKNRSCLVIDAADDSRQNRFHQMPNFSHLIDKVIYVKSPDIPSGKVDPPTIKGSLQKDSCSCSIFALDHSFIVATFPPDLHERLGSQAKQEGERLFSVTWNQLSPEMVKNSQSTTVIKHYIEENPSSKEQILELTQNNTRNYGFEATKQEFLQIVNHYCKTCSDNELQERLRHTTSQSSQLESDSTQIYNV
ncbi:hypothetical protein [Legionella feeleii]|uniref:Dot/Icm T4SS effector n=1 Tax=Legionella feeleii TaxID=453 RepID=A0A0W0TUP0_9GAMM|nr:hypothetical protein [Legionella feeleii]KTC99228.1 hypothetical protein Lfee_1394 [Legionella feeleii]SPX61083.1 Uncharacterised protein [Legionella feeleii]